MGRRPLWIWIAAVVAPLLTWASATVGLLSLESFRDQRADRFAGKEVEGKVRPGGVVAYTEQQLARGPQRAVVLGDSLAHSNVHNEPFAKQLGLPPRSVARISIPGSGAPTWYALLDNHVLPAGHPIEWVVVVASLPSLLQQQPASPAQRATLAELMDDDDDLLRERLDGGQPTLWSDLLVARVKAKQLWVEQVRGGSVGWLFGAQRARDTARPNQSRVEWGTEVADRASARVFDRRRLDLHQSRALVDQVDPRLEALQATSLPTVADSWLPDLARLCRERGVRLALVKPPMSPTMPPEGWDRPTDDLVEQLGAVVDGDRVVWLDDSRVDMSPNGFRDEAHMAEGLARRYAMLVAARLARIGAGEPLGADAGVDLLTDPQLELIPPAAARPLPGPLPSLARTRRFDLSFLRAAADRAIIAGAPFGAECLPVEVHTGVGELVPAHPDGCWGILNDDRPGTCFDGTHLWVRTQPDDVPIELHHVTTPCPDGRRWLAPGAALRWPRHGDRSVQLAAVSPAPLSMAITSGPPPQRQTWSSKMLDRRVFRLPRKAPAGMLEVRNAPGAGPVLLLEATTP